MRVIFVLLSGLCLIKCVAQDYDYPDFRSKKDNFLKMREKEIRSDLSSFTIAGIEESMGKQSMKSIPIVNYSNNFMHFQGNDIQVMIRAGRFDPAKHKLGYSEKYLVKIDNKPFYGNYGSVPRNNIESIKVIVGRDTVEFPPTAFADLYNPNFTYTDASGSLKSHNGVYLSPDNHKIYIYMLNREPASSYEVTWVIENKKYLRRVVDFGLLK
ncbi:MAG: hypothetical protein WKF97_24415 [Chitinophagaceae bacterium]